MNKEMYYIIKDIIEYYYGQREKIKENMTQQIDRLKLNKDIAIDKLMKIWNKGKSCNRKDKKEFWKDYKRSGKYYYREKGD